MPRSPSAPCDTASLARGMALLEAFGAQDSALGNAELVRRTGLSRSTVSRMCASLVSLGWMRRDARGKFLPGNACLNIARDTWQRLALPELARPGLQALANKIQGVVALVVLHRGHALFVDSVSAADRHLDHPDAGHQTPLMQLAAGRALLPWLQDAAPRAMRRGLAGDRPDTGSDWPATLVQAARDELLAKGYCSAVQGDALATSAIGVPLMRLHDGLPVALHCHEPCRSSAAVALDADLGQLALAAARDLRQTWSAQAPGREPARRHA